MVPVWSGAVRCGLVRLIVTPFNLELNWQRIYVTGNVLSESVIDTAAFALSYISFTPYKTFADGL